MSLLEQIPRLPDLESIVRAQAKVRVFVGLPVVVGGGAFLYWTGASHEVGITAALVIAYILLMAWFSVRLRPFSASQLALSSAILDPLMQSAWLPMMHEYGGLVVGFYLFTILGFGFRTGVRLMRICQLASIIGFSAVLLLVPFWRAHPVIWLSFLTTLIIVPLYATLLITKLQEARAHAEQESMAKSDLLARVSHELRTPLSGIMAATQLLGLETTDAKVQKRAETILGLSKDLLHEINDLLDQSKYEAQALVLESAPFQLMEQMERVRLTIEPAAVKKALAFRTSIDPRILGWVQGDAHYLCRVLINLAGNGVKFTDQGEILIGMHLLDESDDEYRVRFTVQDTGIGIAREHHDKIFEPFFQAEGGGTTRKYGGTGLGMTIARDIVRLMGGDLRLASEPGKGSLFYFDISLTRVAAPELEGLAEQKFVPVTEKRIFVVDDHETNLMLVRELLEQDNHQVTVASSGIEALQILSEQEFDLVLLDFNLGDMDGLKLLQIYRFGKLHPAPAYFLTADATLITGEKLRNSGAAGVLTKPIVISEIRKVIAQLCAQEVVDAAISGQRDDVSAETMPVKSSRPILKAVPTQPIDHSVIEHLRSISGRPAFLRELLLHAEGDIRRNCDDLVRALATRDVENIRDMAHALKGVCASIGAVRLMTVANGLMRSQRDELKRSEVRLRAEIAETTAVTLDGIRNILQGLDDDAKSGDRSTAFLHTN